MASKSSTVILPAVFLFMRLVDGAALEFARPGESGSRDFDGARRQPCLALDARSISWHRYGSEMGAQLAGANGDCGRTRVWFLSWEAGFWPNPLISVYPRWQVDGRPSGFRICRWSPFSCSCSCYGSSRLSWSRGCVFALCLFPYRRCFPCLDSLTIPIFRLSFVGRSFFSTSRPWGPWRWQRPGWSDVLSFSFRDNDSCKPSSFSGALFHFSAR